MRPARFLPLLALALALAAASGPAAAQPPAFPQPYQVRAAVGDIPTTAAMEPAGGWNVEQRWTVQFSNGSEASYAFAFPAGAALLNASCACNGWRSSATADGVTLTLPTSLPSGSYVLTVGTRQAAGDAFAFSLRAPAATTPADRIAILYVPHGKDVDAPIAGSDPLPSTDGTADIIQYVDLPSPFWASIHPESAGARIEKGPVGMDFGAAFWALGGLLAGILLWAFLVSRGMVQRKGRRQVAATAAHVEAAANDPPAVLEGKKRALLAALKEIEVATMNNEMPPEVHDAVKADLKKQAVTVMRALEASAAEPKA